MNIWKSPLTHRFIRELRDEFGKYLVIFLLLLMSISFVSGFLVADNSMIIAYNEGFTKYNVEHGHFQVRRELNKAQEKAIRNTGVTVYELFYTEYPMDNGSTMRIFPNREEVNLACLMKGVFPTTSSEIAVDRMYAENNNLQIGDTLSGNGHTWTICGLVALPDYSCLFQNVSDSMFDAVKFGVAVVSGDGFEACAKNQTVFQYAWKYGRDPADEIQEHEWSEALLEDLREIIKLEDYVPQYQNSAITFTGEDMGSDKAMIEILLVIIILIMAFVFGVTISDTIRKESCVIGTLLASGYTRRELLVHYMTMPLAVTLAAALAGNILGYTVMKNVAAGMYYGSYSLPTYVTVWNAEAFLKTTVMPIVIMVIVTGVTLYRRLKLSPIRFLRRDLSRRKKARAFYLPHKLPILSRYRIRIILQNAGSYLVLFCGIMFANLLLMFGTQLPKLLEYFQAVITDSMIAEYQTILKIPLSLTDSSASKLEQMIEYAEYLDAVSTEEESAEKFSVYTLETPEIPGIHKDRVMLYGIQDDSRYIGLDMEEGQVYISNAYAEKYDVRPGDEITLLEAYEDKSYTFRVSGIADYMSAVAVFMPMEDLNRTFGFEKDMFAGYFSKAELTDIDRDYISTVIDLEEMTKLSRQLTVSFGGMMYLIDFFAVVIYMLLIYLMARMIIEKNAQSISIAKILGFTDRELSGMYITSTTIVVILSMIITIPLLEQMLVPIFTVMIREMMSGWFPIVLDPAVNLQILTVGMVTYGIVALLEMRKIRAVSMEEALKNVE